MLGIGREEGGDDDKNRLSHYAECATFSPPLVSCRIGTKEEKERKSEGCCTQGDKQKAKKSPLARWALCADSKKYKTLSVKMGEGKVHSPLLFLEETKGGIDRLIQPLPFPFSQRFYELDFFFQVNIGLVYTNNLSRKKKYEEQARDLACAPAEEREK